MTIHYHGTPLSPRSELLKLAGKHFCVSFADARDADECQRIGQSVMFDSGAFTAHTQKRAVDWSSYFDWLEPRLGHPHWAVIPDVIDADEDAQRAMVATWPFGWLGAPVWHMALSVPYLLELADAWPRIRPELAQQCYPWPMVLKLFAEKYGEVPTSVGLVKDDITFRVLVSPDGGTWTAFMVNRQGVACPITSGTQWHPGNNPVKDEQG